MANKLKCGSKNTVNVGADENVAIVSPNSVRLSRRHTLLPRAILKL